MVHRVINDIDIPNFVWQKVKPLKQVYRNLAFDTETEEGRIFLISNSDKETVNDYNNFQREGEPEPESPLLGLLIYLNNRRYTKSVNWFYNLQYDTNALLKYLSFDDRKHIAYYNVVDVEGYRIQIIPNKELKIAKLDNDNKPVKPTFFYDLAQFYDFKPLKKLAEQTDYSKVYVDDISQVNIQKYYNNKEYFKLWNDRCVVDCLITVEIADKLTKIIQQIVNVNKYKSKASIARRYVLENMNHNLKMPNIHVLDSALQAFHAGHIEACKIGDFKNIHNYDLNCFDTETELLTEKGFKKWDEFTKEDKAATYNLETGHIEYQNILHIHKHKYDGDLLYQKNENLDIMATPNHRIYYQVHNRCKNAKNPEEYNTWSDYKVSMFKDTPKGNIRIPTNGIHPTGIKPDIDKDWIKLCAWVITEGHFKENSEAITIYQSDKYKYHNEIRKILNNVDVKFTERNRGIRPKQNYASYEFYISSIDGKYIRDSLNNKKEIPKEWVLNWDKESLEVLFWELMKGDGSFKCQKGKADFKSYNDHDLDMLNLIAFKIGYKTSINYKNHTLHIKLIRDGNFACIQSHHVRKAATYNGMVWCVTVPNDTVVVRRNGKIFITGNSAYPAYIAELYETNTGYLHNREYEPDTAYSFYLASVEYYDDNLSPIWFFKSQANYHINGKCDVWLTQMEIEYLQNNGYPVTILQAYHIKKNRFTEKPFEFLVKDLYKMRLEAKERGDEIQLVLKVILNSIFGVTLNAVQKRDISDLPTDLFEIIGGKLVYYENKYLAGNMYNPVYGCYITANVRTQLFTDFKSFLPKILSVNTDGVYLTHNVNVPTNKKLGGYSHKKLDRLMIMGSGRYFVKDKLGIIDNVESKFRGIPLSPVDIEKKMVENKDSNYIELTKEKPIKLKESVRIPAYKDKFNTFQEVKKQVYFKTDRRYWFNEINNISDLWDKQIDSRPFDIEEVR